ncbi:MAG: hypothetical protein FJ398_22310 [Verrucomicrobia bacterium]|nr:hypothetical protein [Verrucomicrobiota bacterium]
MDNGHPLPRSYPIPPPRRSIRFAQAAALFVCLALVLVSAGCGVLGAGITGSGHTVTKDYDLTAFSRLAVGNAFQVEVTQGPKHGVAITVDDNLVEHLDVTQAGETLRIKLAPGINVRQATMKAAVTLPELTGLDLSGAVRATLTGFSSDKRLDAELSGASNVNFDEYPSGDTAAHASGASRITVAASGNLVADASGASTVSYVGDPKDVRAHTSGASSVRRK